ncbi:MAG: prepilin-type N-terminal cleavage/methylation domain-containing protein [Planctomycetes bacterium]|nr:prepilin-type N-terminal cleavage/methylation domain-containing protein [Planctomycetota bacterium]
MARRTRAAFTLIELLVVAAIVAVLASLLLAGLRAVIGKSERAVAKSMIQRIETALANYYNDEGRYPRLAPRPAGALLGDADAYRDDCVALWIGLMNKATREAGGGADAPYLEGWDRTLIGLYAGGSAGLDAGMPTQPDGTNHTTQLPAANALDVGLLPFQLAHLPSAPTQLVLLDPWGNPFHYREWASVRDSAKEAALAAPVARSLAGISLALDREGQQPPVLTAFDAPRRPTLIAIWSNGPNGINEYGHPDSDDVTNWSVSR